MTASGDTSKRHALIVEDDLAIRELVRLHLSLAAFDVTELGDGTRALELGRSTRFDLIVLDLMLPGIDGITLCRAFRDEGANMATPILMLTARDSESDKVLGLESGADDYLTSRSACASLSRESAPSADVTYGERTLRPNRAHAAWRAAS
jgi:DNA-binding response OmpR family regulator